MSESLVYSAGIMMGLFSAPHCIGMCGGLQAAYSITNSKKGLAAKIALISRLNLGRVLTYSVLGGLAGALGIVFADVLTVNASIMRTFAGTMIVLSGLYISGLWTGLRYMESAISRLMQKIRRKHRPNNNRGFIAGLFWGCLPCGLVYTALSIAITQSDIVLGALFMMCFGLGTIPVMISVGLMSMQFSGWMKSRWIRGGSGVLLMCYGLWTLSAPWYV